MHIQRLPLQPIKCVVGEKSTLHLSRFPSGLNSLVPIELCHKRAPCLAPICVNTAFRDMLPECLRAGFVVGK
jgi:hypothetical protein